MENDLNWSLSFSELAAVLARMNAIADDRRPAFQARLNQFLKLGALPAVKQGRGRRARYGFGDVMLMSMLCEVTRLGLFPDDAIALIKEDVVEIFRAISLSADLVSMSDSEYYSSGSMKAVLLYFCPNQMRALSGIRTEYRLRSAPAEFVQNHIASATSFGPTRQLSLVNVTTMLREFLVALGSERRTGFLDELRFWSERRIPDDVAQTLTSLVRR